MEITLETVLKDLNYSNIPQNAKSSIEWSNLWGFGIKKTLKKIKSEVESGKMGSMWIPKPDITGKVNNYYVYWYYNE